MESEAGKGSRFTINLPLSKELISQPTPIETGNELISSPTSALHEHVAQTLAQGIVLLAEDNMANIMTIGDYLESHGYQVVVAHDGFSAIEQAEALQPNIILMDIQMPALDGLEAIRRLRALLRFTTTPIIALTALAMPGDRERCLAAGANEYMSKPVSLKGLVNKIKQLLQLKE